MSHGLDLMPAGDILSQERKSGGSSSSFDLGSIDSAKNMTAEKPDTVISISLDDSSDSVFNPDTESPPTQPLTRDQVFFRLLSSLKTVT